MRVYILGQEEKLGSSSGSQGVKTNGPQTVAVAWKGTKNKTEESCDGGCWHGIHCSPSPES